MSGKQTMGDRIRDRRIEVELTQEELADEMGTTQAFVSKIEKLGCNSLRRIAQVAAALDCRPSWIAWGDERDQPYYALGKERAESQLEQQLEQAKRDQRSVELDEEMARARRA